MGASDLHLRPCLLILSHVAHLFLTDVLSLSDIHGHLPTPLLGFTFCSISLRYLSPSSAARLTLF